MSPYLTTFLKEDSPLVPFKGIILVGGFNPYEKY